jgi:hypothetical protein
MSRRSSTTSTVEVRHAAVEVGALPWCRTMNGTRRALGRHGFEPGGLQQAGFHMQ